MPLTAAVLVCCSLGALSRAGLDNLFSADILDVTDPWTAVSRSLPGNLVGCALLGFLLGGGFPRKLSPAAAKGITTGFCGSLTTWSSFVVGLATLAAAGQVPDAIIAGFIGLGASLFMFRVGAVAGRAVAAKTPEPAPTAAVLPMSPGPEPPRAAPAEPSSTEAVLWWVLAVAVVAGLVVGLVLDDGAVERRSAWLAGLLAMVGGWGRWRLSVLNKPPEVPHLLPGGGPQPNPPAPFFMGTFIANVTATAMSAGLQVARLEQASHESQVLVIVGVQVGFCGALSTMSTFASEVYGLEAKGAAGEAHALRYLSLTFATSVLAAMLLYAVPVWAADTDGYNP